MSKKIDQTTVTRHLQIYSEDWEFLDQNFGKQAVTPVGVGATIRAIVHQKVQQIRSRQEAEIDSRRSPSPKEFSNV